MDDLSTIAGLHHFQHSIGVYCPSCRRWAVLDLEAMVRGGHGEMPVTRLRPRCRRCGMEGEKQVRPPVPDYSKGLGQWPSPEVC